MFSYVFAAVFGYIIWLTFQLEARLYFNYLFGVTWGGALYYYMILGMVFGWIMIPESVEILLYFFILQFPHVIGAILIYFINSILISVLIAPRSLHQPGEVQTFGNLVALCYFMFMSLITVYRNIINQERYEVSSAEQIFEQLFDQDMIAVI